ncbi:hypothetical protein I3843_03G242600 [Carya illinoinensis]|nr:hypothetical protein I3843_03G242600 [Carya illinoinensis]
MQAFFVFRQNRGALLCHMASLSFENCKLERQIASTSFYVDGQWRYDESQHHESGEYSIVNTLLLGMDYMDVDNEAFRRMA